MDDQSDNDKITEFVAGQVISDPSKPSSSPHLVIETADDGKNGLLAPLMSGFSIANERLYQPYWATIEQVANWEEAYVPGARLLTAYARGTKKRLWEAYVPDFSSAQNVMREVNLNEKRTIDLEITSTHESEIDSLDDNGLLGPDHARDAASNLEVEYFSDIEGSMTSSDGLVFVLRARGMDGTPTNVAFPHSETSVIVEHIAVQSGNAKDKDGRKINSAFRTSSFALGTDPEGNAVLGMQVGSTGTINFQLNGRMAEELMDLLAQYVAQRAAPKARH